MNTKKAITKFNRGYFFLSNFYQSPFLYGSYHYRTVEHFYQSEKTFVTAQKRFIISANSPSEAKRRGRLIPLRDDWEAVKVDVMRLGLSLKFTSDFSLADELVRTGKVYLEEGNTWHDNFWGNCSCEKCNNVKGLNILGALLMELRYNFQSVCLEDLACSWCGGVHTGGPESCRI